MAGTMKIALFAKRRQTIDTDPATGKQTSRDFWTYLTTLVNKESGETVPVQVKFRQQCGAPDPSSCPCFIMVDKSKANLSWERYSNDEGEELTAGKLWVTEWSAGGEYEDHSLDMFDAMGV